MIRLFLNLAARRRSNPGRDLALRGAEQRRLAAASDKARAKAIARQMRRDIGLPEDPRLA